MMGIRARDGGQAAGFTLIEVLFALGILVVGALALGGVLTQGMQAMVNSQSQLIAIEKANEAIETVFKARDTRLITWSLIRNVEGASGSDGGIFIDGPLPVRTSGNDGIVNTADDGAVEEIVNPGPDGLLGTDDDERVPLSVFSREIEIRDVNSTLRQIRVIIKYRVGGGGREYVLLTYISQFA